MNIIFSITAISIANKEFPFETKFDITDLNHRLQEELRNEILASLAGVEYQAVEDEDADQPDLYNAPEKRGPGRPRKNA